MTKLFKNSKQILSIVVAFAVIALSLFTGTAAINASAVVSETVYWDGTTKTEPTTQDSAGNYIIDSAEKLAYIVSRNSSGNYKVADGIKAIVLQPEDLKVADKTIMDATSVTETKSFFENATGAKTWASSVNYTFAGTLDFNGATVYGMYYNGDKTIGLVGKVKDDVVVKNVSFKNCYISTSEHASFICGYTNESVNLEVSNIVAKNSYINGSTSSGAIIAVSGSSLKTLKISNAIFTENEYTAYSGKIALYRNNPASGTVENVICTNVFPQCPGGWDTYTKYSNVYSNVFDNNYNPPSSPDSSEYIGLNKIEPANIKGSAVETACPGIDWVNTFFANTGTPELRVFHNVGPIVTTDIEYHYYKCDHCGLTSEKTKHNYDDSYKCLTCERQCLHQADDGMTSVISNGDCVTKAGTHVNCPCGYSEYIPTAGAVDPEGHKFTVHNEANCGDCQNDGVAEHWICEVCGKIFVTDNINAPMDDALTDPDTELNTGVGPHKPATKPDSEDKVIMIDNNGHWYECTVCDGRLDFSSNKLDDDGVAPHIYEEGVCVDCYYECPHDFKPTGRVVIVGDCTTDEESEVRCTICALTGRIVTKEAAHEIVKVAQVDPTEQIEGTKEHYQCKFCKTAYADEKGTIPAKTAELVIPTLAPQNLEALMAEIEKNSIAPVEEDETEDETPDNTTEDQEEIFAPSPDEDLTVEDNTPTQDAPSNDQEPSQDADETVVIKKTTNVTLESQGKVFADSVEVKVERINDVSVLENIKTSIKDQAKKFAAYEITAQSAGTTVQPNGTVVATFNIPSGYNLDRVAVLYLDDAGKAEKLKSTVDKENNTVKAEIDHFSKYIVVETKAKTTQADTAEQSSNSWIWIVVAVVVVLLIAGAAVFFFVYKKKKA